MKFSREASEVVLLYENKFGERPSVSLIGGGGSSRIYFRLSSAHASAVGVYGPDPKENECFISLSECFKGMGVNVPEILEVAPDKKIYLIQDLGDISLLDCFSSSPSEKVSLAKKALSQLIGLQLISRDDWEPLVINSPFSRRLVAWDLNYFKYELLKPSGISFDEDRLEDDFEKFSQTLCEVPDSLNGFMYRDFQSRNIMVYENQLYFIDYQGGRLGPVVYDAVSFLWQAKAKFSMEQRNTLIDFYADELARKKDIDKNEILRKIPSFALLRTLQVLGAYGLRGLVERKPHFISSIPPAVENLLELKNEGVLQPYPELSAVTDALARKFLKEEEPKEGLTLSVCSFSYKKGYPDDPSGNGGGFMFDCRALHNPGRYEKYKTLTGRDAEVIEFLEDYPEVTRFIDQAIGMVSPAVDRYLSRGFNSLQVGFGCTGGQHRSVYCAETFAKNIKNKFGNKITVMINHREQNVTGEVIDGKIIRDL